MGARRTDLESGATVVSEQRPGVESASLGLYFPTGSRHETPQINGISHLIEHLVFKGTRQRSAEEINREIDLLGGVSNAYTSKETICLHGRVLARHLPRVLDLYADMAVGALPPGLEDDVIVYTQLYAVVLVQQQDLYVGLVEYEPLIVERCLLTGTTVLEADEIGHV